MRSLQCLKRKVEVKVEGQMEPSERPRCPPSKLFLSRDHCQQVEQDTIQPASAGGLPERSVPSALPDEPQRQEKFLPCVPMESCRAEA